MVQSDQECLAVDEQYSADRDFVVLAPDELVEVGFKHAGGREFCLECLRNRFGLSAENNREFSLCCLLYAYQTK